MALQTVFVLLLAALCCNSAYKLDKLESRKNGGLTIYRGTSVNISEVPFMARMVNDGGYMVCSAAIINDKFLLTSVKCAQLSSGVVVGSDKMNSGYEYEIKQFHSHPDFCLKCFPKQYDIAVIELAKNLTFGETVQPIALAGPDLEIEDDAVFEILGFGFTPNGYLEKSHELIKAGVPYLPSDECLKAFSLYYKAEITDYMICSAVGPLGEDACPGDQGDPLVYKDSLIGVASWIWYCGDEVHPTVYVSVSAVRSFIDGIIN